MPASGRAPRQTPSALPTDPPLPAPLATSITAQSTGKERSKFPVTNQPPALLEEKKGDHSLVTSRLWATKSKDSVRLRETLRDLERFLTALPFPLIKITPVVVARIVCRALATQGVMPTNVAFDIALLFWRMIINIFFRSIQPRGAWRIPRPEEGPVIFVGAPHHNQFLDPLLLASEVRRGSGRRVAFLIAEKSIKRRFIGAAARLMQSIPVARAADSSKPGKGALSLHASGDPCLIQGHGSQFTKQLVVKGQIVLPKATGHASAEVVEVISDTEIRIKKEFKDQKALDALRGDGCLYHCLPFVDQRKMYASVYESLSKGGSLGIFPEGGSHDRTDLLPLKAGVVIMALGAMSANPGLKVRIVPVGLSYFHPHKFRSRAVVEFGAPMEVPRELVGLFEQGGDGKKKAVGEMMDIVYDGLKSVTMRAPDYDTLMFIQAGRRLYTPPGAHPSLSQVVELNRRFILGYLQFKDEPRVIKLKENILKYNKNLIYAGLRDHQVERATRAGWRSLGLLGYRLGLLAMWGALALPGVILNSPVIILAKIISRKKAKEALAASQVKLAGRDVIATWKVLVSLGFTPILYCFYAGLATYLAHRFKLPTRHQLFMPFYAMTALPTIAYSTLKFSEVGIDIYKSLPPLFVSLMPGNYKVIQKLQETRASIASDLHFVIDDLGPKVFDNFDQQKMLMKPNASAPPQPSTPGREESVIWKERRNSAINTTSYLTHPLAWADERLFGWGTDASSSSAKQQRKSKTKRNASAGGGQNRINDEDSEAEDATEGLSEIEDDAEEGMKREEEEEEGDYEDIFRMLNPARFFAAEDPKSPKHDRNRSGSGETFSEKRTRSNSDLKSLLHPFSSIMSTSGNSGGDSSSGGGGGGGGGNAGFTSALGNSPLGLEPSNGAATTLQHRGTGHRQRTHSLKEEITTAEIKEAGTPLRRQDFEQAGVELEEKSAESRGGQAGLAHRPALQEMKSAETTPSTKPSTPEG
ncbi:hypothetical protein CBS101457_001487 [Exobasidium rhododendri]|nr:hypothetical protein CBS101457_001487 [Exobasidium rhododendri]